MVFLQRRMLRNATFPGFPDRPRVAVDQDGGEYTHAQSNITRHRPPLEVFHGRQPFLSRVCLSAAMFALQVRSAGADLSSFTRLVPTHPTVIAAATAFPGGGYNAENILESPAPNGHRGDYASHGLGAKTFIDFDLGRPERVAAFRHIQRRTLDTIAEASLLFSDTADFQNVLATVKLQHVDEPGGDDLRRVRTGHGPGLLRRQVTSVLPGRSPNVGGQGIEFFAAGQV